ncbi:purine-binding chemotaxis protein CheW [Lachnospiraceae bacterium KH1T2]|jgi:purine-binding chemotaxis protein CheW|nr:purine-binding chemotaxis protein CheW [Lachnospiraceae bacterium KH1T2]
MAENEVAVKSNDALAMAKDAIQYIVVGVGNEQYGIDIKYIDNIVRISRITRVPTVQPYFKGVINLRGEVVAVMSLRLKMNLDDDEITNKSRIIIIKMDGNDSIGILVDEVKKVVTISDDDIERAAHSKNGAPSFISGVGKVDEGLVSILDLTTIIDEEE